MVLRTTSHSQIRTPALRVTCSNPLKSEALPCADVGWKLASAAQTPMNQSQAPFANFRSWVKACDFEEMMGAPGPWDTVTVLGLLSARQGASLASRGRQTRPPSHAREICPERAAKGMKSRRRLHGGTGSRLNYQV